jgi:4-diphosphocytidyl-2-C-methyl-D-erythritol kinase
MSSASFTLPCFAKINLDLRVLGRRIDGFHELRTVFQTISLHDRLSFESAEDLTLSCDAAGVPTGPENLVFKAASELRRRAGIDLGARLHLEKFIPSPGGLGGGSSDAAAALIGLNRLWKLAASRDDLHNLAESLGSDVPFFLYGGTALGEGRGEKISILDGFRAEYMIVVTPDVEIPTGPVFAALKAGNLTNTAPKSILNVCRFDAGSHDLQHSAMKNDLEPVVFARFPEVRRVKSALLEAGASFAAMSGSGASVFGIFEKKETRQTALKALEIEPSWRKFAVAAISRSEYREALSIAF